MTAKPKMQWGPGKMKRVSVRKKLGEEEGQHYTPIYVTFFLKTGHKPYKVYK